MIRRIRTLVVIAISMLMLASVRADVTSLTQMFQDGDFRRGGAVGTNIAAHSSNGVGPINSLAGPIRVAYQGEPGAYSEKSTREFLGSKVIAVGHPSFEACFRAVASMECDYACLPIENSLGGSIHENYDLMLRYDLTVVGEHEFRVHHCLLAKPGVKRDEIKYAMSHPQALAQCDNFLRSLGITPVPTYDTAGSAKMIATGSGLPDKCTPENTAAIASDLAGRTYGLNCLDVGIEDDDTNFTRFLLLARRGVAQFLTKKIPSKTSIVFTLPNAAGALYKALACFSLRDIDFSKIESRPTSASLLNFLKFRSQQKGRKARTKAELPRFRYCFYFDILASELDENTQNALAHLREQADYLRVLGSYPQKSRLVGPVKEAVDELKNMAVDERHLQQTSLEAEEGARTNGGGGGEDANPLNIGIVGFGNFGQFLARRFVQNHSVSCMDPVDKRKEAKKLGVEYYAQFQMTDFLRDLDVVILSVPLIHLEEAVLALPAQALRGKLVVEVCPLNVHPKKVLLNHFTSTDVDILSSHPMFGPSAHHDDNNNNNKIVESTDDSLVSWDGRPFVFERVRISNVKRLGQFLRIFEEARCQMVEMTADQHDASTADAEFVTHLTGQLLDDDLLPPTPVVSKEYAALCDVADMTNGGGGGSSSSGAFDLFFGMFKYHPNAKQYLNKMRENLANLERALAAKDAYYVASMEMKNHDRQRLIAETKLLLQEIVTNNNDNDNDNHQETDAEREEPVSRAKEEASYSVIKPKKD